MTQATNAPRVTVRREIEASPEELFDAWLDPASLAVWMRPQGVLRATVNVDPQEGGAFEIVMHTAQRPIPHTGVYRVIDRPRRLVFTWISPVTEERETLVTVEFHPRDRTTEVVVTHERLLDRDAVRSHTEGWRMILDALADELSAPRKA